MRRIAKATGASIVTTLADMEGNETFDPKVLGEADEVNHQHLPGSIQAILKALAFFGHTVVW